MKLLFYTDESSLGGVANWNHAILAAALREGWSVHSMQPVIESPLLAELQAAGCQLHWIPYNVSENFVRAIVDASDAARVFDEIAPELIVFSDCCPISNIAAKHCAIQRNIPFVTVSHSSAPYLATQFAQCLPVVRSQLDQSREVLAVSASSLHVLHSYFGLKSGKGRVVHSGRPARFFTETAPELRAAERLRLGLAPDALLVVTTARVDIDKGCDILLAAIQQLRDTKRLGKLRFVWAGEGSARTDLLRVVKDLSLDPYLSMPGQHASVATLYDAADLFVLPTRHEAFGLSIAEAMAKGLPVIATRVGGVPEVIGDDGFYLPDPKESPGITVQTLADLLARLAQQQALRTDFGKRAKKRAQALFTEERMQSQVLQLLTRVAASHPSHKD